MLAVKAKNVLVIGFNVNTYLIFTDKLPAQKFTTTSDK